MPAGVRAEHNPVQPGEQFAELSVLLLGADDLAAVMLLLLQPVALARPTRKALRRQDVLPALRTRLPAAVQGGEVTRPSWSASSRAPC